MNPEEFAKIAIRIYGRKKWMTLLALDLGVQRTTIFRLTKREQIPGPYEIALQGLWRHKQEQDKLDRLARKLAPRLPKGYKKRHVRKDITKAARNPRRRKNADTRIRSDYRELARADAAAESAAGAAD